MRKTGKSNGLAGTIKEKEIVLNTQDNELIMLTAFAEIWLGAQSYYLKGGLDMENFRVRCLHDWVVFDTDHWRKNLATYRKKEIELNKILADKWKNKAFGERGKELFIREAREEIEKQGLSLIIRLDYNSVWKESKFNPTTIQDTINYHFQYGSVPFMDIIKSPSAREELSRNAERQRVEDAKKDIEYQQRFYR